MLLKSSYGIFLLLVIFDLQHPGFARRSRVPLPGNGDSCNVVNLHCGGPTPEAEGHRPNKRYPGPPGKVGPKGLEGPQGIKGDTGSKGSKGEQAIVNMTEIINSVAGLFGATSCSDLRDKGIKKNGYYQIRSKNYIHPVQVYCDFQVYEGISDCQDLRRLKAITAGRYLMRTDPQSAIEEIACASTCHELLQSGIDTTEPYTFSDGNGTFQLRCNFTEDRAITEILHDQMGEIQNPTGSRRCDGKGCYSWAPSYQISRNRILSIIEKSRECRQLIKSKCVKTNLLKSSYAWWVSRDGEKMLYWGGATSRRDGYCACGETGTCIRSDLKCNCDSNDANTVVDEGYLTDKTKLPVQELRFGDLDQSSEYVWHTLGKLECWGEA